MSGKMNINELRRFVLETLNESKEKNKWATIAENAVRGVSLNEHTIPDKNADINDMNAEAVWDIMTGDDASASAALIASIGSATGWGEGALKKAGLSTPEGLKKKAMEIWGDQGTFSSRVSGMVAKLNDAEGFPKPEMPALEGGDAAALQDLLDEEGEFNIDIGSDFGGGTADFEEYAGVVPDKSKATGKPTAQDPKDKEEQNESLDHDDKNLIVERWKRLAGINEISADERFPFPGPAKVMPGAPNLGAKGTPDLSKVKGVAKKFITKGKGNKGDTINIDQNQPMLNSQMKPTQTNVKAAKSMLFALLDVGQDMEGAFASSEGEIIDGHHRWSGQWLRSGGDITMDNVHVIDKSGMSTEEFLTMLTVAGNAMGRPTKLS